MKYPWIKSQKSLYIVIWTSNIFSPSLIAKYVFLFLGGGDYTALPSFLVKQLLIKEKVYSTTLLAQLGYSEIKSSHF